jgi:hypothetical protein
MEESFFAIRPPVFRGEKDTGQPKRFAESMSSVVADCDVKFPEKGLCMVTKGSPRSYKTAVERVGVFFTREMGFDSRPFTVWEYSNRIYRRPEERTTDANTRSFLWYDAHDGYCGHWPTYGGCTFRLRGKTWMLGWIWIHPYRRRKGDLAKYWPFFRSMFGVFFLEPPISDSLISYIRKISYDTEMKREYERLYGKQVD